MASKSNMRDGLSKLPAELFDRLDQMGVGFTTTIRGVVVTRWSTDMFEIESHGRYAERHDEAAINLAELCGAQRSL